MGDYRLIEDVVAMVAVSYKEEVGGEDVFMDDYRSDATDAREAADARSAPDAKLRCYVFKSTNDGKPRMFEYDHIVAYENAFWR